MEHKSGYAYNRDINVKLLPKQRRWLEGEVSAGRFASLDEAVEMAICAFMAIEADDSVWVKPKADDARASVRRGEIVSSDDYLKSLDEHITAVSSSL